jgi:hypothetical protein
VIKMPEEIILPTNYVNQKASDELNEFRLDDSAITIEVINNQDDQDLYNNFEYTWSAIKGDELHFDLVYPD